jgi:hypothetical protein
LSEHGQRDEGKATVERRRFLKAAAVTAWAAPIVLTIAPRAHAAISPLPCGTQGMPCGPSAPIGGPDTCCGGLTCVQTQGSGDPALITFTCQP